MGRDKEDEWDENGEIRENVQIKDKRTRKQNGEKRVEGWKGRE